MCGKSTWRRSSRRQGAQLARRRALRHNLDLDGRRSAVRSRADPRFRSEEHTSELQSLMRISYAVFCLKKKKNTKDKIKIRRSNEKKTNEKHEETTQNDQRE